VISFATLSFALVIRNHAVPAATVIGHRPVVAGLIVGGVISAAEGTRLVANLTDHRLTLLISVRYIARPRSARRREFGRLIMSIEWLQLGFGRGTLYPTQPATGRRGEHLKNEAVYAVVP
jgi:hypothetical protein